jgi:DnaJ-class molecular chaperone with C-terminal Zn finger domain
MEMKRFLEVLAAIALCLSVYQIEAGIGLSTITRKGFSEYYYEVSASDYGQTFKVNICKTEKRIKTEDMASYMYAYQNFLAVIGIKKLQIYDIKDPLNPVMLTSMDASSVNYMDVSINPLNPGEIVYKDTKTGQEKRFNIGRLGEEALKKAGAKAAEDDAPAKAAAQASQPVRVDYGNIYSVFPGAQNAIKAGRKPAWYEILNVNPTANQDAINKAYKVLTLTVHPDKHPEDAQNVQRKKFWDEVFALLNNARDRKN